MERTNRRNASRRKAFEDLRKEFPTSAAFADALGEGFSPSYVSQLLSGNRNIGDEVATKIEERLGLVSGFLDRQTPDELPAEISALLGTITDAAHDGTLSPEQAHEFALAIRANTINPTEANTIARDPSAAYRVGKNPNHAAEREKIHTAWPFSRVSLERILSLSKIDLAYVEGKLSAAIEECEATAAKRRTSGRA